MIGMENSEFGLVQRYFDHRFAFAFARASSPFLSLRLSSSSFLPHFATRTLLLALRVQSIMGRGSRSDKETTYEFRDIVLAKVRGYPPWPGMVRSSSMIFLSFSLTYSPLLSGRGSPECFKRGA
jgi:hypothetical protein